MTVVEPKNVTGSCIFERFKDYYSNGYGFGTDLTYTPRPPL